MKYFFHFLFILIGFFCLHFEGGYTAMSSPPVRIVLPTMSFSVTPTIAYSGDTLTYRWQSINARSCHLVYGGRATILGTGGTGSLKAPGVSTRIYMYCIGAYGSVMKSVAITILPPKPTLDLIVTPNPITVTPDAKLTIQWSSTSATGCYWGTGTMNNMPSVGLSGSFSWPVTLPTGTPPLRDFVQSMTCVGNGGSITKSIPVTVTHPKPTLDLTVSPNPLIITPDSRLNVQWSSTFATGCYWGTGVTNFAPSISLSGSQSWLMTQPIGVAPLKDFVLSMTCIGNGGSITKSIPVTVTHPKPTLNLTVSPTIVNPNEQITVTWNSTYATGCYWGTGSLPYNSNIGLSGSIRYSVPYLPNLPAEGNHIVSMHCKGNGGTVVKSVPVTVNVQKPQVYLTSSTLIVNPVGSIRVDWYSAFATDCYYGESKIPGPRTPALSGSIYLPGPFNTAIPPRVSVYCEGPGGSAYNSLQFQYPSPAPFSSLIAYPNNLRLGQSTNLQWFSTNSYYCTLDTGSGAQHVNLSGSLSHTPPRSLEYLLSCTGTGGTVVSRAPVAVTP